MENEGYETIDLLEVLNAVRQHLLAVILTTVILAGVGFGVSKFLITPQYEASALMIVNTRQDTTSNVTSDQINSATKLVSTYSIIIKSDTVLQQVIDNLGLSLTYEKLAERVTVSAVDDTQVMKITVKSDNPEWARQVCEQITVVSPDVILESVEAGSVKVISSAAVNPTPVSPNVGLAFFGNGGGDQDGLAVAGRGKKFQVGTQRFVGFHKLERGVAADGKQLAMAGVFACLAHFFLPP